MPPMAGALHVVLLGFRRRLHGPESSPKRERGRKTRPLLGDEHVAMDDTGSPTRGLQESRALRWT